LQLRSPEAVGTLTAQAKVHLDTQPVGGEATIAWDDVVLPADLVGQALATHGTIDASGNAQQFSASGKLGLGPPKQIADVAFKLTGTPDRITLAQFDIAQPQTTKSHGTLHALGDVTLKPKLGWDIKANAEGIDPAAFAKDWPGAIDFAVSTSGTIEKDGAAGKLKLERLA